MLIKTKIFNAKIKTKVTFKKKIKKTAMLNLN